MSSHLVIDGNAFYEIDDDCVRRRQEADRLQKNAPQRAGRKEPETEKQRDNAVQNSCNLIK